MTARHQHPRARRRAFAALAVVVGAAVSCGGGTGGSPAPAHPAAARFGPALPRNRFLGPAATSTMHADSGSSDSTPLPGPGTAPVQVRVTPLGAVCPTILVGGDGLPVALCTRVMDLRPMVVLLDPADGHPLASLDLAGGSLFGGVYGYLDHHDRMVLVDGAGDLLRVGHRSGPDGWSLAVDERVPLSPSLVEGDAVTGLAPGYDGLVWFATGRGVVGTVATGRGRVATVQLRRGERVTNSISTAPVGTAVATDRAVYLLRQDPGDGPAVVWRRPYLRGPARKPGMLARGTGSTPTFLGPTDGSDYVAVVDDDSPRVHLLVIRTRGDRAGRLACRTAVLGRGGPASENSPVGIGRTVVVAGTYGYEYPRLPEGSGPSNPTEADFRGGMTRVDVRPGGRGCDVVWDRATRSAAVPRLSTRTRTLTTLTATPGAPVTTGQQQPFAYTVLDADTGRALTSQPVPDAAGDPLQLAGTIGPGRVLYQGTVGSVLVVRPAPSTSGRSDPAGATTAPGQR